MFFQRHLCGLRSHLSVRNPKRIGRSLLHETLESRVVFTIDAAAGLIDFPSEVDDVTDLYGSQIASQNIDSAEWELAILDQSEYAIGSYDVPYQSEIKDWDSLSQQDYASDYSSSDFIDYAFDPEYIDTTYYEPTDIDSSWEDSGQYQTIYDSFSFDSGSSNDFSSNSNDWSNLSPEEISQDIFYNVQSDEPSFYANDHGFVDFANDQSADPTGSNYDTSYDHGLNFETEFYSSYSSNENTNDGSDSSGNDGSQSISGTNNQTNSSDEGGLTFDSSGRPGFRVPGTEIILAIGAEVTFAQRSLLDDRYGSGASGEGNSASSGSFPITIDVVADGSQFDIFVTVNSTESLNGDSITGTETFSYFVHYQLDVEGRLVPLALTGSYNRSVTIDINGIETIPPSASGTINSSGSEGSGSGDPGSSPSNNGQVTGGTLTYSYFSTESLNLVWSLTTVSSSYSSMSQLTTSSTEQFTISLGTAEEQTDESEATSGTVNTGSLSGVSTFDLTSFSSQSLAYVLDVVTGDYMSYTYASQNNSTVSSTRTATGNYSSIASGSFAITGTITEFDRQAITSQDTLSLSYQGTLWVVGGTSVNSTTTT